MQKYGYSLFFQKQNNSFLLNVLVDVSSFRFQVPSPMFCVEFNRKVRKVFFLKSYVYKNKVPKAL
jgi:hypothetical protein